MESKQVCIAVCFAVVLISTKLVFVEGVPILGPDMSSCVPVIPPKRTAADAVDCCFVGATRPIKNFKFNLDLPMRVRRPAHKLDDEEVRKYERAVALMKALPPDDGRSFQAQANLHCAYCGAAYNIFNVSNFINVHSSWLVTPFHRWYLYFYERILGSLVGDDTLAVPYWAWDVQNENYPPANVIPAMFNNKNYSLYSQMRSKIHQPPIRANLDLPSAAGVKDPDVQLQDNYYHLWRTMIGQVRTAEGFYGGKLTIESTFDQARAGAFEVGPHAAIHIWTGDQENVAGEDMCTCYSAARDPIFHSHHSQADRLWEMWQSWGGEGFDDSDWLDSEFIFYDENGDLVRVNVRDSLNFDNFRVTYEQDDPDWLQFTPKSIRDIDPKYAQASFPRWLWREVITGGTYRTIARVLGRFFQRETNGVKAVLGGVRRAAVTSRVSRTAVLRSTDDLSVYDEVMVISGVVEKPFDVTVMIKMFLELPEADENTVVHCVEYLGTVAVDAEGLAQGMDRTVARKFTRTLGIRDTLQILDIVHQKSLEVTFVPAWDPKHDSEVSVNITGLTVEMKRAQGSSINQAGSQP